MTVTADRQAGHLLFKMDQTTVRGLAVCWRENSCNYRAESEYELSRRGPTVNRAKELLDSVHRAASDQPERVRTARFGLQIRQDHNTSSHHNAEAGSAYQEVAAIRLEGEGTGRPRSIPDTTWTRLRASGMPKPCAILYLLVADALHYPAVPRRRSTSISFCRSGCITEKGAERERMQTSEIQGEYIQAESAG